MDSNKIVGACETCEGCQACQSSCQSCTSACTSCTTSCEVSCQGCQGSVCESCQTCQGCQSCQLSCQESCTTSCTSCTTCQSCTSCTSCTGCEDGCQAYCTSSCISCTTSCEISCTDCQSSCEISCESCTVCESSCEKGCQTSCESTCQSCESCMADQGTPTKLSIKTAKTSVIGTASIIKEATITTYMAGERFNPTGLVIQIDYSDSRVVKLSNFAYDSNDFPILKASDTFVIINFFYEDKWYRLKQDITVTEASKTGCVVSMRGKMSLSESRNIDADLKSDELQAYINK